MTGVDGRGAAAPARTVLSVRDLEVSFPMPDGGMRPVVTGISFDVERGRTFGLVGESGSGKTVTALAIMGLLSGGLSAHTRARLAGSAVLEGEELVGRSARELREVRGAEIAMIFQDPTSSLNPSLTVGHQIIETIRTHQRMSRRAAAEKAVALLDRVGIPSARIRLRAYPHEFSGGMRQRAMIAIALSCDPKVLIADEPTTALDVTVQAQVLDLLRSLQAEFAMGVLFITHDLGVIADSSDRLAVMYAGEVVEEGSVFEVFEQPRHPYTEALLASTPYMLGRTQRTIDLPEPSIATLTLAEGCRFAPRCVHAIDACRQSHPALVQHQGRLARCIRADELKLVGTGDGPTPRRQPEAVIGSEQA